MYTTYSGICIIIFEKSRVLSGHSALGGDVRVL